MKCKILTIIVLLVSATLFGCGGGNDDKAPTEPKELLAFLEAKIKQNPKDAELYYERGRVLLQLDEITDAINSLTQAIALKSGEEKYHLLLALRNRCLLTRKTRHRRMRRRTLQQTHRSNSRVRL